MMKYIVIKFSILFLPILLVNNSVHSQVSNIYTLQLTDGLELKGEIKSFQRDYIEVLQSNYKTMTVIPYRRIAVIRDVTGVPTEFITYKNKFYLGGEKIKKQDVRKNIESMVSAKTSFNQGINRTIFGGILVGGGIVIAGLAIGYAATWGGGSGEAIFGTIVLGVVPTVSGGLLISSGKKKFNKAACIYNNDILDNDTYERSKDEVTLRFTGTGLIMIF